MPELKDFINKHSILLLVIGFGFAAFIFWCYDTDFKYRDLFRDVAMLGAGSLLLIVSLASEPKDVSNSVHRFGGIMFGTLIVIIGFVDLCSYF